MNIPKTVSNTTKKTENVKVQANKLTGLLTSLLRTKMTRGEVFTCSIIYETAHSMLSQHTSDDAVGALRFLAVQLRGMVMLASSETASCVRDLLRVTGCLQDMISMFLDTTIMPEQTWKTLCECLVKSCQDSMENKTYCSSLIPTCIQRCKERSDTSDTVKVLHCLLLDNTCNLEFFVNRSGLSIFTRETLLRRNGMMELLATVVQNSAAANFVQHNEDLVNFLITFGESNQESTIEMAEWASIILFKISSAIQDVEIMGCIDRERETEMMESHSSDLTSVSFLYKGNWDKIKNNLDNPVTNTIRTDFIASSDRQNIFDLSSTDLLSTLDFAPNCTSSPKAIHKVWRPQKDIAKRNFDNSLTVQKLQQIFKKHTLRDITRKLKTGMYIYGCNFKKISQVMWPQERIAPKVLYRIYRKYILGSKQKS